MLEANCCASAGYIFEPFTEYGPAIHKSFDAGPKIVKLEQKCLLVWVHVSVLKLSNKDWSFNFHSQDITEFPGSLVLKLSYLLLNVLG